MGSHVVVIHDDPDDRVAPTIEFVRPVVEAGGAAIVVARRDLRTAVADAFPDALDRLILLDAQDTLSTFDDGVLDEIRFRRVISGKVAQAAAAGNGQVVAMGEMVALLAEQGRMSAALNLEGFWDRLLDGIGLLCAYPSQLFDRSRPALIHVLGAHSHFEVAAAAPVLSQ